jgi:Zn-dependent peptidase ImmA (M78 family)
MSTTTWSMHRKKICRAADALLELGQVTEPPVPVERLARLRGAQLRYVPYEGDLSGLIYQEDGRIIIGINALHAKTRQRFTIAHELGHLELHQGDELHVDRRFPVQRRDANSSQATDPAEINANAFAAELLMPRQLLTRDVQTAPQALDYEDDEFVRLLADRYKVSVQAMLFRLTNLGLFMPFDGEPRM